MALERKKPLSPTELCDLYKNKGLERRCSKWYIKGTEIKNINQWIAQDSINFKTPHSVSEFVDMFTMKYHDADADWYPLPIIAEAQKQLRTIGLQDLCFPLNTKQLMIINYLLRHDEEYLVILTGVGGSGKSTFANIIRQIFDGDVSSCTISDLGNVFSLEKALQKRLIYSDELSSDDLDSKTLKQCASNQYIQVQQKGQEPYDTRCQSAFLWSCNIRPRIDLTDTGVLRRVLYYSMNDKIKNPDKTLKARKWEREDLVNIVAHALSLDMTDWIENFQEESRFYLLCDNPVFKFRKLMDGKETTYCQFAEKCKEFGYRAVSQGKWVMIMDLIKEWGMFDINEKEYEKRLCGKKE